MVVPIGNSRWIVEKADPWLAIRFDVPCVSIDDIEAELLLDEDVEEYTLKVKSGSRALHGEPPTAAVLIPVDPFGQSEFGAIGHCRAWLGQITHPTGARA
jgi:hypothetical protein